MHFIIERYVNEGVATFYSCHMASKWLLLTWTSHTKIDKAFDKKERKKSTRLI